MGLVQLRDYQQDASDIAIKSLEKYKYPFLLHLPTGAGKSYVIADIVKRANLNTLILQPSKEILEQNLEKLNLVGIIVSVNSASMKSREIGDYTIATIGSIKKLTEELKHIELVLIDEAHTVNPKKRKSMYIKFFKALGKKVKVVGLTASPYRLVSKTKPSTEYFPETISEVKALTKLYPYFFRSIKYSISHGELVKRGYLSDITYYIENQINLEDLTVNSTGADFTLESMAKIWGDSNVNKTTYIITKIDPQITASLIFCISVDQAIIISTKLNNIGITADYIHSGDKEKVRVKKLKDFKEGRIKHMLNVGVMTTGVDLPFLDTVVYIRPTLSLSLYYQMGGRVSRIDPNNPNKQAKIIDLVGNVMRFGRIETIEMAKDGYKDIVISEKGLLSDRDLKELV